MDGVLAIDKPAGMTSHDVVDVVRKRLGTRKVGHAGTLDPDATGVLILGVGRATRLLSYAQEAPKSYRAVARFGASTTTQDASGDVVEQRDAEVTREDVERELKAFIGNINQVPPMVSAVKIGGERLYEKARRGEDVERPPRPVTIYELALRDFEGSDPPEAMLEVVCSAGTFVRTLIHDLGRALGAGAHMAALRRTASGGFTENDLVRLDDVEAGSLLPLIDAVRVLPQIEIDDHEAAAVRNGRPLDRSGSTAEGPVAVVKDGDLLAIYKRKGGMLAADRVVPS
jgi:tRNA pseudouridine55 synthase